MFKLQHWSGKYVHPQGGKAIPEDDTRLVLHGDSSSSIGGSSALLFTKVGKGDSQFKFKHWSGKYVHPQGGKANPDQDTQLLFWGAAASGIGGDDALAFEKVDAGGGWFKLKHWCGKYVHPQGGKANPDNETVLLLFGS